VEVLSLSDSEADMQEKTRLYFDAGAQEVWLCDQKGKMSFLCPGPLRPMRSSKLWSRFPTKVQLHRDAGFPRLQGRAGAPKAAAVANFADRRQWNETL